MPTQIQTFATIPALSAVPNPRDPDQQRYDDTTYTFEQSEQAMYAAISGDTLPKLNALIGVLNAELGDINTVAAADAEVVATGQNIESVRTTAQNIILVSAVGNNIEAVVLVARNMPTVLEAKANADRAEYYAGVAQQIGEGAIPDASYAVRGLIRLQDIRRRAFYMSNCF